MAPPFIFIVPGLWEGPESFAPLVKALEENGFPNVHCTALASTGTSSKSDKLVTMNDDIAAIAADLSNVVEESGESGVVAVMHSAGGFLGSSAMQGLTAPARRAANKAGGVTKIVFLAAGLGPEGHEHTPQPFMEYDVGFE